MLIGELSAQVGYTARLGWVEVELEPLVTGTEVVDLKAPMAFVTFVAKLTRRMLTFHVQVQCPESQLDHMAVELVGT